MTIDSQIVLYIGATGLAASLIVLCRKPTNTISLPPSPPSDPIIGHARRIPLEYSWETFSEWRKSFGDIIYINLLGRPAIILNTLQGARDLFEKSGSNFSDRPHFLVMNDMVGLGATAPFMPYGDRWRQQRRLFQRYLDPQAIQAFRPIKQVQVQALLQDLLLSPDDFINGVKRFTSSLSLKVVYGDSVISSDDKLLGKFKKVAHMIAEVGDAGGTIIDLFPILRYVPTWLPAWFPGVAVKRHAIETHDLIKEIMNEPVEELRAKKDKGISEMCIMSKILDDYEKSQEKSPEMEEDIRALGVLTFTAGFDTANAVMLTLFLMLTLNPSVVKTAQAALDEVTNGERLLTLEDRPNLPYIDCLVKEAYRIRPPGPVGLPHQSVHEEKYGEWTIPAGSMVIANMWEIINDEANYPEPRSFKPERYLKPDGSLNELVIDPTNIVYGFGRRVCPGRFFADATIWLAIANVLACFDIGPVIDPDTGEQLFPAGEYMSGFTSPPKVFKSRIVPRSGKHARLIMEFQE